MLLIFGVYWLFLIIFGVFILVLVFFGVVVLCEEKWEGFFLFVLFVVVVGC